MPKPAVKPKTMLIDIIVVARAILTVSKKVVKINIKTGKVVHTYDSVKETGNIKLGKYIKQGDGSHVEGKFRYEFETRQVDINDLNLDEWKPIPDFADYMFSEKQRLIYCISRKQYIPKSKNEQYRLKNKGQPRIAIYFNSLIKRDLSFLKSNNWRQIPDFSSYYINKKAAIYSTITDKFWYGSLKPDGYVSITLKGDDGISRKFQMNQLMGIVWLPNPENKPTVNHKDKNPSNNCLENLEWATDQEQAIHSQATRDRGYVITQFNEDNEVIAEFNSIAAASKTTGLVYRQLQVAITNNKQTDTSATDSEQCFWRKVPT